MDVCSYGVRDLNEKRDEISPAYAQKTMILCNPPSAQTVSREEFSRDRQLEPECKRINDMQALKISTRIQTASSPHTNKRVF